MTPTVGPAAAADEAEASPLAWLQDFERSHGRPLRVLHIGNIANNAYLNATFLRRAGIDCHVLCYDYYDPMATPEWENAEGGRPKWFVQGPQGLCVQYLHALLDGRHISRIALWVRLGLARTLLTDEVAHHKGTRFVQRMNTVRLEVQRSIYLGVLRLLSAATYRVNYVRAWTWSLSRWAVRRAARAVGFDWPEPVPPGDLQAPASDPVIPDVPASSLPTDDHRRYDFRRYEAMQLFAERFPTRPDRLAPADFAILSNLPFWGALLDRYDVVQCYATAPIMALLTATRPYVAFEHGTLRDFTLGDSALHRLNALAYREADHVFITNGDCLAYAERLGIERYSPMIHPIDVDRHEAPCPEEVAAIRQRIGADVILFCPIRHDWAVKGTDVHLRALPEIVAGTSGSVRLVLCEWGAELPASRALIEELGMADHVVWLPPQDRQGLITNMKAAAAVLDQMALPHFGATAPQAIAAGTPVVMSYEPARTEWIVDEPAPILAAFDPAGVARAVATALDPAWRADFEERAHAWSQGQHHPRRLVLEHCRVYRRLIEGNG